MEEEAEVIYLLLSFFYKDIYDSTFYVSVGNGCMFVVRSLSVGNSFVQSVNACHLFSYTPINFNIRLKVTFSIHVVCLFC